MTGWEKVIAVTLLVFVAMVAFNIALWRRLRIALAHRPETGAADFDSAMMAEGCAAPVPPVVRAVLTPYYLAGADPAPGDTLSEIGIGNEEIGGIVADAFRALSLPMASGEGGPAPVLTTVADLARYLSINYAASAETPTSPRH